MINFFKSVLQRAQKIQTEHDEMSARNKKRIEEHRQRIEERKKAFEQRRANSL